MSLVIWLLPATPNYIAEVYVLILEFESKKKKVIRAAVVIGDAWPSHKVVLTDTEGPLVKPDLSYNDSVIISLNREDMIMENHHIGKHSK